MSGEGGIRASLPQQTEGVAEAISALQMMIDSGRAKLAGGDAKWQLQRLKDARATLIALAPVADILRAVLRLPPERLASLRELLARWAAQDAPETGEGG